jgi:hypothetical protein
MSGLWPQGAPTAWALFSSKYPEVVTSSLGTMGSTDTAHEVLAFCRFWDGFDKSSFKSFPKLISIRDQFAKEPKVAAFYAAKGDNYAAFKA